MRTTSLFLLALIGILPLEADVKLPSLFGDHMVLQQESKVPIWGTADAGESVTVTAGDHTATATADGTGKWRVDLSPFASGTPALTVTVAGHNTLQFHDVLIGDVWVASGQSNMEVPLSWVYNRDEVIPQANDPQLRFFYVAHKTSFDPQADPDGKWVLCTPDTAKSFSAVAYFFGRELRARLNHPVGILGAYVGGTPAQAWISLSGLEKDPPFIDYVNRAKSVEADEPNVPARIAAFKKDLDQWNSQNKAAYDAALAAWNTEVQTAKSAGQPLPPKPAPPAPIPQPPADPGSDRHTPTVLFNGLIAPVIPYAIKGVIWYQGEDNAYNPPIAIEYRTLFPRLITDWREKWGQGDFPFLFVQLAGFEGNGLGACGMSWPLLREAQAKTLSLPNTGMATAIDIGAGMNIHPIDKMDVGLRLALDAMHVAYGEDIVYTGPTYDKMAVEGAAIRVSYTQTGGGLIIGSAPWTAPTLQPIPATSLLGFTISGADKKFYPADARIDGTTVVLSSPQVPAPMAARYFWDNLTQANLYNKEGLPAFPFRTDEWDNVPSPATPPLPK
jgi:sialate O-acetylesterase